MARPDPSLAAALLADRAAAVVRVVGRAFSLVILFGAAAALAVLALYSSFDASGARAIGVLYAVVAALAIARLIVHRVSLTRQLGPRSGLASELQRLTGRTSATPTQASDPDASTTVVVRESDPRSPFDAAGFTRMDDLRDLNADLGLAGLARRTRPLRARAIGVSTLAILVLVLMTMAAPLLLFVGLLAKALG